jgi:hypothetical protein
MTTMVSVQFRPTMSMLTFATTCLMGTGGWSAKKSLPHRPRSSPLTVRKIIDRRGRGWSCANASASSITATVPEASSSAPLQMESPPRAWQRPLAATPT